MFFALVQFGFPIPQSEYRGVASFEHDKIGHPITLRLSGIPEPLVGRLMMEDFILVRAESLKPGWDALIDGNLRNGAFRMMEGERITVVGRVVPPMPHLRYFAP